MSVTLSCQDEQRREGVHVSTLNGLDYVEVSEDRLALTVFFLGKAPAELTVKHVLVEGGRRIRDIRVLGLDIHRDPSPRRDDCLILKVDKGGDFSTYRLCVVELDERGRPIVEGEIDGHRRYRPFRGFDPRYACVDFSFMAGCPSDLDCRAEQVCPPEPRVEPEINYLAKDYASFRQLLLDRLALLMPEWRERHVPDLGITLVELLAYVGDYLSYYQDAVGTETYLDTARQRISVRRHARLVDYRLHEGCNARAWICLWTDTDVTLDPTDIFFITETNALQGRGGSILSREDLVGIDLRAYEVFEPRLIILPVADRARLQEEVRQLCVLLLEVREGKHASYAELHRRLSLRVRRLFMNLTASAGCVGATLDELRQDVQLLLDDSSNAPQIRLYQAHSEMQFYTWGNRECCLPKGATSATLRDDWDAPFPDPEPKPDQHCGKPDDDITVSAPPRPTKLRLRVGDVLIFKEVLGPKTGNSADADPTHRHAVRLTRVEPAYDPLYKVPVVEIEWADEDALSFPLCISATLPAPKCRLVEKISVVCGNVILVDHGSSVEDGCVVVPTKETKEECLCDGASVETIYVPEDVTRVLERSPITFAEALNSSASASQLLVQDPRRAVPWIRVKNTPAGLDGCGVEGDADTQSDQWEPRLDLLESGPRDRHFVAEIDNDRRAHLRFGDGELGARPAAQSTLKPTYRVGSGQAGNVGAETITHIVFRRTRWSGASLEPRNPMPARGGADPEPVSEAKLFAPHTFRTRLERAITAEDYAQIAERHPNLQDAAAALRWTGSWYEASVGVDPRGTEEPPSQLLAGVAGMLYRYRRMGHDLAVMKAVYVPIALTLDVCVAPHYLRGHVEAAMLERFSSRFMADGQPGFFHSDRLSFGGAVFLSKIVAEAQAVPGVTSVYVRKLERYREEPQQEIEQGLLKIGPMEIAQLANDPSFPERGVLTLEMRGGR
jgi:hypothetical protein